MERNVFVRRTNIGVQDMNPMYHARSSAKIWGGHQDDYIAFHTWFDESKAHHADFRHRALRHHSQGIFAAEERFGAYLTNSNGVEIPTRILGEQHVKEDLGFIPSLDYWLNRLKPEPWMAGERVRKYGNDGVSESKRDRVQRDEELPGGI